MIIKYHPLHIDSRDGGPVVGPSKFPFLLDLFSEISINPNLPVMSEHIDTITEFFEVGEKKEFLELLKTKGSVKVKWVIEK